MYRDNKQTNKQTQKIIICVKLAQIIINIIIFILLKLESKCKFFTSLTVSFITINMKNNLQLNMIT